LAPEEGIRLGLRDRICSAGATVTFTAASTVEPSVQIPTVTTPDVIIEAEAGIGQLTAVLLTHRGDKSWPLIAQDRVVVACTLDVQMVTAAGRPCGTCCVDCPLMVRDRKYVKRAKEPLWAPRPLSDTNSGTVIDAELDKSTAGATHLIVLSLLIVAVEVKLPLPKMHLDQVESDPKALKYAPETVTEQPADEQREGVTLEMRGEA
jgi:hypothetical protein